ncbi:MAG: hypothetical protein IKI93_13370, partial [Clostridia bacterium]|nr:hypothetical protein [Clostridia bacterium]
MKNVFLPLLLAACMTVFSSCSGDALQQDTVPALPSESLVETLPPIEETIIPEESDSVPETDVIFETQAETEPETVPETEPPYIPTEEELLDAAVERILDEMTPEEKLGQMILCAYENGISPSETAQYGFGGYVLFAGDFAEKTPETISAELSALQEASEYGLIFAADEEGGSVVRVSKYPQFRESPFLSPRDIYASSGTEGLYADAYEKGMLLSSLGINMNLAPVADIAMEPDSFIYQRSLGLTGEDLIKALSAIVGGQRDGRTASCVKHFPGYGSAEDTHTGMAADHRSIEELEEQDLLPFYALCEDGIEAVMVSHIIADGIDSTRPASVSPNTVAYIRENMGYSGIIMTDDLAMAGITDFCTDGNAALEAVLAGF